MDRKYEGADMRLYDGHPDKELKAKMDADAADAAAKKLAAIGARATYFPMEEKWMVFKNYKAVTGFHPTIQSAAAEALSCHI